MSHLVAKDKPQAAGLVVYICKRSAAHPWVERGSTTQGCAVVTKRQAGTGVHASVRSRADAETRGRGYRPVAGMGETMMLGLRPVQEG